MEEKQDAVFTGSPGPAIDTRGLPVIDPSKNVLDLVKAAVLRLDDLRVAERRLNKAEMKHQKEITRLHAAHFVEMQGKETERVDSIRKVDAEVAARAQAVQATQASTLAAQVQAAAEAVRTTQTAQVQASQEALSRVVAPLQAAIDDLRRAQYEQQGKTSQVIETRDVKQEQRGGSQIAIAALVAFMVALSLGVSIAALVLK